MDSLKPHFDAFIESAVTGVRKPDPRIFEMACSALAVRPTEAIFLDDIGMNCKAGRQFGFTTIKVSDPEVALDELAALVGLDLRPA
jgi:putative hydrolase of the HAD superfamily